MISGYREKRVIKPLIAVQDHLKNILLSDLKATLIPGDKRSYLSVGVLQWYRHLKLLVNSLTGSLMIN